jgi:glucosamine-6-phosphate deaminase
LVANGADKQQAVARLAAARGYESDWPATVLAMCRKAALYADASAAALLPETARSSPVASLDCA